MIAIIVLCSTLNPEARSRTPTPHLLCKTQSQKSSQLRLGEQFGIQGLEPNPAHSGFEAWSPETLARAQAFMTIETSRIPRPGELILRPSMRDSLQA